MNESISYEFKIKPNELIDAGLLSKISKRLGVNLEVAAKILKANVVTSKQLSIITGKADSTIRNLMREKMGKNGPETMLDAVYPFRIADDWGPVFIHVNEKCVDYIKSTFKPII